MRPWSRWRTHPHGANDPVADDSGLAVDVTLDEMATALGFVVGKKAGAQPGDRVTFALTDGGAVVREIHVEVVERAMVVDRLHLPATLLLKMPVGVMTVLVVYTIGEATDSPGGVAAALLASALTLGLHAWRRSPGLSIFTGTLAYMALVNLVF